MDDIAKAATDQTPPVESTGPDVWEYTISKLERLFNLQESPVMGKEVLQKSLDAMRARREFGLAKYGMPLRPHNGQDPLHEAYQEALDTVAYLACRFLERPSDPQAAWDVGEGLSTVYRLTRRIMEQKESR